MLPRLHRPESGGVSLVHVAEVPCSSVVEFVSLLQLVVIGADSEHVSELSSGGFEPF